jgi:glycosyltransferase involved in cell wall biosynthesis
MRFLSHKYAAEKIYKMKKNTDHHIASRRPKKFFTVIMPCYNGQKFIAQAIESVLRQTFPDFELIIINYGSTDDSLKIIESFAKQDKRIQVISNKKNRGLSATRNRGLDNTKGRFVAFLDCDDWWPEEKLATYAHAHKRGHDLVFSNYHIIHSNNKKIIRIKVPTCVSFNDLKYSNHIPVSSAAYNFEKIPHKRFKVMELSEDWLFWLEVIKHLNRPIGIQTSLMIYRQHDDNMSANKFKMIIKAWDIFRTEHHWGVIRSSFGMFRYALSKVRKFYL